MKARKGLVVIGMVMGIALSANAQSKKTNVKEQTTTQQREQQAAPETHNSRKLDVKAAPAPQQPTAPQSKPAPNATEQNKQTTTSSTKLQETTQVNAGDNNERRVESSKKLDPKTVQKTKPKKSAEKMSKGKN